MNTELLRRVEQVDPAPPDERAPDGVWDAQEAFEEFRQRTGAGERERPGILGGPGQRRIGWVVALGAAAAAVLLIGGAALLSRTLDSGEDLPVIDQVDETFVVDEVEPEEPPEALDDAPPSPDIPDGAKSGTIDTPAGTATWVHLTGSNESLPRGRAIPWPNGFAIFEPWWQLPLSGIVQPPRLWVSPDGIEWRLESLPAQSEPRVDLPGVSLAFEDGVYWLSSSSPARVWRSNDGTSWDELDPTGLLPPGPVGLSWSIDISSPVSVGDVTLAYVRFYGSFPISDYAETSDDCHFVLRQLEPAIYELLGVWDDQQINPACARGVFRFVETETGLRVLDDATGVQLGEIVGADLTHIAAIAQGPTDSELAFEVLALIEDGVVTQVVVPWVGDTVVDFFGADDVFYAYVQRPSGAVTVWQSTDGRSWTDIGPPRFLADSLPDTWVFLESLPNGSLWAERLQKGASGPSQPLGAWSTIDGVNWEPMPLGRPDQTYPVRLATGWFATRGDVEYFVGDEWWMNAGGLWVSLAPLGFDGVVFATASGDTTFFYRDDDGETANRDLWILTIDRPG